MSKNNKDSEFFFRTQKKKFLIETKTFFPSCYFEKFKLKLI